MAHKITGGQVIIKDMNRFLAVVATWLMVLVALAQGGPGGPGGPGGGGSPTISFVAWKTDWLGNAPATNAFYHPSHLPPVEGLLYEIVYQKGGSAQVQLFFQNNNPQQAFTGQLIVEDARYIHDSAPLSVPWGAPPPITIPDTILSAPTASLNIGIGQTAPATLTISGLPAFVTKGHIQLQLKAEGNFGAQPAGVGNPSPWNGVFNSQTVYIAYSQPTGVMVPVWIEVAELSCTMAQGESGLADVNRELVKGLYFGGIFYYNLFQAGVPPLYWVEEPYLLTVLLGDIEDAGGPVPANCWDINGFLILLHQSQGIDATGMAEMVGQEIEFVTNPFCPIGSDPTISSNHIRVLFTGHFVCVVNSSVNDSALGYLKDLSGGIYQNPAWIWDNEDSWQVVDTPEAYGLVFRKRLPGSNENLQYNSTFNCNVVIVGTTLPESVTRTAGTYNVGGVE